MAIWFLTLDFVRQYFGACHNSTLNFLIQPGKEFTGRLVIDRLKGQDRLQFWQARKPLMATQFGSAVISQEKSHFLL